MGVGRSGGAYNSLQTQDASLANVWAVASKGSKTVKFYTEFASPDAFRRGVAISRLAEILDKVGDAMEAPELGYVVKQDVLERAREELRPLKPYLTALNGGKYRSPESGVSIFNMAQPSAAGGHHPEQQVEEAAAKLYEWLSAPAGPLRGLIGILSMGGVFYAGMCAEKTARAAIDQEGGGLDRDAFLRAAKARLSGQASAHGDGSSQSTQSDWSNMSQPFARGS